MLYIFDLDGTLVDSLEDLRDATEYALKTMGYDGYPLERYQYFVGNGVKKLLERAFQTEDEVVYTKARALFDEYYFQHCLDHTLPYDGLSILLSQLHEQGHTLGVVTNKPDALAKKICGHLFSKNLDFCQGQVDHIPVKPNPHFVLEAIKKYQFKKEDCVYIGDSDVDIYTGKNAGVKTIGVTWGNRTREELENAGADIIVDDVIVLGQVLGGSSNDCL